MISELYRVLDSYSESRSLPRNPCNINLELFKQELVYDHDAVNARIISGVSLFGPSVAPYWSYLPISFLFKHAVHSRANLRLIASRIKEYVSGFRTILRLGRRFEIDVGLYIHDTYSGGYFHWMCDCLQKLVAVEEALAGTDFIIVLPNRYRDLDYIGWSLNRLGYKFAYGSSRNHYLVRSLYVIDPVARSGNYNCKTIKKVQEKLLLCHKVLNNPRRLYISRRYAHRRRLEAEEVLEARLSHYGITTVYPEELTIEMQMKIFRSCSLLIGLHGGGLTNIIYMNKNTSLIEIRLKNDSLNNCYFSLASCLGINYYYIEADSVGGDKRVQNADFSLSTSELQRLVDIVECI